MALSQTLLTYFDQYRTGTLPPGEQRMLFQSMEDDALAEDWKAHLLMLAQAAPTDASYHPEDWQEMLQAILQQGQRQTLVRSPFWRIAAAAIFILAIGGAIWLWNRPLKKTPQVAEKNIGHDVGPGGNKAVLTLANSHRIILDSAANGILAKQGRMDIVKLANGQLEYRGSDNTGSLNTLTTPYGGQYRLTLPDGTAVWLNAASSITYPTAFTGRERRVDITGEVYFEVVHNEKMPFRVKAGNAIIEDIGTHFNVNTYGDEPTLKTTLLEGAVKISIGNNTEILKPGQQAQSNPDIAGAAGKISIISDIDIDKAVAWKNNLFIFSGDDIPAIMRQLERWYNVKAQYKGDITGMHFSGIISRNNNISQVLKMLESTEKIKFGVEGTKVTVMPK